MIKSTNAKLSVVQLILHLEREIIYLQNRMHKAKIRKLIMESCQEDHGIFTL